MRKATIATITAILLALAAVVYLSTACSIKWTKPDDRKTLEHRGVLVKVAARRAVIEAYRREPGDWKDHVCSVATIVLKALDGDDKAIADSGLRIVICDLTGNWQPPTGNAMTIETKDTLLGLLAYTAKNWDLGGWKGAVADAIELFDAFVISGVTTEHEVWFLTREFFAGISEGCVIIDVRG